MSHFAPGDFSHLDLSGLNFIRNDPHGGNFKVLKVNNCNFDGATFVNIQLYEADFSNSSLRGVDFSKASFGQEANMINMYPNVILNDTDMEGAYVGKDWVAPSTENVKNTDKLSRSRKELEEYRKKVLPNSVNSTPSNPLMSSLVKQSSIFTLPNGTNTIEEKKEQEDSNEIAKLREENRKLKKENAILKKHLSQIVDSKNNEPLPPPNNCLIL
jgi:hypothetical protein